MDFYRIVVCIIDEIALNNKSYTRWQIMYELLHKKKTLINSPFLKYYLLIIVFNNKNFYSTVYGCFVNKTRLFNILLLVVFLNLPFEPQKKSYVDVCK